MYIVVQYNLNGSNMDCSFTVEDSNSFSSPCEILSLAQENICLGVCWVFFFCFFFVLFFFFFWGGGGVVVVFLHFLLS